MSELIIKLEGHYLYWSTCSDSFASFGMALDELREDYREQFGARGIIELEGRLARVESKGTSSIRGESAEDTIWLNRAGPGEMPLSRAEMVEWFVRRKEDPTKAQIVARRATFPKCDPCVADDGEDGGMCCPCWGSGVRDDGPVAT